jgi:hypothetical protein
LNTNCVSPSTWQTTFHTHFYLNSAFSSTIITAVKDCGWTTFEVMVIYCSVMLSCCQSQTFLTILTFKYVLEVFKWLASPISVI